MPDNGDRWTRGPGEGIRLVVCGGGSYEIRLKAAGEECRNFKATKVGAFGDDGGSLGGELG